MNEVMETKVHRERILLRLLLTFLSLAILFVVMCLIKVISLIQYAILLITLKHSEPLRSFSNKAAAYAYKLMRYITLNENQRPFPFSDLPPEMEAPEDSVRFD
jgi:hypothetical protein